MKKQFSNPDQLCFSIGRPLPVLVEEVQKLSHNPQVRKAAEQMLKVLHTFELANEAKISKSARVNATIYEIIRLESKLFYYSIL